jgi:hypothetical protein
VSVGGPRFRFPRKARAGSAQYLIGPGRFHLGSAIGGRGAQPSGREGGRLPTASGLGDLQRRELRAASLARQRSTPGRQSGALLPLLRASLGPPRSTPATCRLALGSA